jgi:ABC-type amino acid transport substrate-binding protein
MTLTRRALMGGAAASALMALGAAPARARCEDVPPEQRPQNTPREFIGQTMDEIIDRGTLVIAVYEDFAPYSWLDGSEPKGIDIEVGKILAEALGVKPEFRFVQSGETINVDLMANVWRGGIQKEPVANVMMRVPYNSTLTCLIDQVTFSGQYADERIAIAYRTDAYPDAVASADGERDEGGPVPAFFRFDPVAVENDSISDFYLTSFPGGQIGPKIRRFKTMGEAMAALKAKEVMAAMGPRAQLEFGADETIRVHAPPLAGFALSRWTLGLAVHQSHKDLSYALDDAITAALADGRLKAAHAAYGVTFTPPTR